MQAASKTPQPQAPLRQALRKLVAERPAGDPGALPRVPRSGPGIPERLDLELTVAHERLRLLVTGQIGVGKSTELHAFGDKLKQSPNLLAIRCDLEKEMSPERCGALGVLLAIFRDAWSFHRLLFGDTPPPQAQATETLGELVAWLQAEKTASHYVFQFGGMRFPIGVKEPVERIVAIVLGKAAQHQALLEDRPIGDQLVVRCNKYLDYLADKTKKKVLLLVDHVDKVRDERAARQTLIEAVSHWGRLRAGLVMTAPYEFTLGDKRSSVEGFWGRPVIVYPEPTPESSSEGAVPEFYKWLRSACGLEDLLADQDLRRLAYYSGGVPRTFVLLLSAAVREALYSGHASIHATDARRAVSDAESDYQDYSDEDLALLDSIVSTQQGLGSAWRILRSPIALLVRPRVDGGTSFHTHPLAERSLDSSRLRRRLAAARAS